MAPNAYLIPFLKYILFSCILLCILLNRASFAHQFPELMQDGADSLHSGDKPIFRMSKINIIWIKAKQLLNDEELARLYAELMIQDGLELELKKTLADNQDEDGLQQAIVRRKFFNILKEFRLDHLYDLTLSKKQDDSKFDDLLRSNDKLSKLWTRAELSAFSAEELDILRTEFQHHLEKVREYELMKKDLNKLEAMEDNSVEGYKKEGGKEESREQLKQKRSQLKTLYKDVMKSYQLLDEKTHNAPQFDSGASSMDHRDLFADHRIRELWTLALKSNLTEQELTSFREELGHFQKRISKQEYFAKEAELVKANIQLKRNSQGDAAVHDLPPAYRDIQAKAQDYAGQVKKWYSELKSRLLRTRQSHAEL